MRCTRHFNDIKERCQEAIKTTKSIYTKQLNDAQSQIVCLKNLNSELIEKLRKKESYSDPSDLTPDRHQSGVYNEAEESHPCGTQGDTFDEFIMDSDFLKEACFAKIY